MVKQYMIPFGERGKTEPDLALERIRQAEADKQEKKMKREDELEEVQHRAKLSKAEAEEAEAKRKADEATKGAKPESPLTIKPVEVDIQAGEKAAEERAKRAEEAAQKEREAKEAAEKELATEKEARLLDKVTKLTEDIRKTIEEGKDKRTLGQQLKELDEAAGQLGYTKGGTPALPPDVQVQIQKMQNDLQIQLEQMRDERDRRDKEWQLTLRKWDEEKEMKRGELAQKQKEHEDRMQFLNTGIDRIGRVIAGAIRGGGTVSEKGKSFHIEAAEGEEGETICPECGSTLFIAPDAKKAICSGCGLSAEVRRTVPPAKESVEEASG